MKHALLYIIFLFLYACNPAEEKNHGFFPIKECGKYGYINEQGRIVIPCQFDEAENFSDGLAAVLIDSLYGFIDTSGKIVIKPMFKEVWGFSDKLCFAKIETDSGLMGVFIHMDGKTAFVPPGEVIGSFSFGRAAMKRNNNICVIDTSGKIIFKTPFPYSDGIFSEGIARVWNDSTKYYDTNGRPLPFAPVREGEIFSEGLALVRINDTLCYIDKNGKVRLKPINQKLAYGNFSCGLARAFFRGFNHKDGFIDKRGSLVIPMIFSDATDFCDGLAAFRNKKVWGFINTKGDIAIKPQFEEIDSKGFCNGLCKVKRHHQWGYINRKGEFVWGEQFGIEYEKVDLSKWHLDTLNVYKPLPAGKYAGFDNYPRKKNCDSLKRLILTVDTTDLTVFNDRYFAYKLYLINGSKDTINIPAQDGYIKIIQQGKNKKGKWQDIENFHNSWCGYSYHTLHLRPNEYQAFATPIFKGLFLTQLRFRLVLAHTEVYSNSYWGKINCEQFLIPRIKTTPE